MSIGDYLPLQGKVTGAQAQKSILIGTVNKVIRLKKLIITASAATTFRLQDDGTVPKSLTAIHELIAGVPLVLEFSKTGTAGRTNAGNGITITTSAGNVAFDGEYWLEP